MKADPLDIYNDDDIRAKVAGAISEHAKVDMEYAEGLADALIEHGILQNHAVFDGPKDEKALLRLGDAIDEVVGAISDLSQHAHSELYLQLIWGPYSTSLRAGELHMDMNAGRAAMEFADGLGSSVADALSRLEGDVSAVRRAIIATLNEIKDSNRRRVSTSRMNLQAIQLVDATRSIWEWAKGKPAPARRLNPATPFALLLEQVIAACGVNGTARSAFDAWAREQEKVRSSSRKSS